MILAAGLLVLTGLGLFLAGVMTGTTAFYWACVVVCVVAAVLLFEARRRITRAETALKAAPGGSGAPAGDAEPAGATAAGATASGTADPPPADNAAPAAGDAAPAEISAENLADPPIEDVEVTDLLLIVDLADEVLVVDEHPRYHLAGCRFLDGRTAIPLPMDEARTDGFTPCALCAPDRHLADRERSRRAGTDR